MDMLKIYGADDLASLPRGVWGIKEPDLLWQGQPRLSGGCSSLSNVSARAQTCGLLCICKARDGGVEGGEGGLDMILLPGKIVS